MLKNLLNSVKDFFINRKLAKEIDKLNLELKDYNNYYTSRELHDTYKLGDFTASVVGSKAQLDLNMLLNRVNKDKKKAYADKYLTDLAYNNLVKVDD